MIKNEKKNEEEIKYYKNYNNYNNFYIIKIKYSNNKLYRSKYNK